MTTSATSSAPSSSSFDAIVVGAGFAGLAMLHKLRKLGLSARVFEGGSGVGGTWFWNRYPGARCDVESMEYSYQFSDELQQDWTWSERYSPQSEILAYLNHVADRFDLRRDIQFETRVEKAEYDETSSRWRVATSDGRTWSARFVIMATGCLSTTNFPAFAGQEKFRGEIYHSGRWPHEKVDFRGKRVGVIGTGSSAIQMIPIIAEDAAHLTVFQRTPNFSVPARNRPLSPDEVRSVKSQYGELRKLAATMGFGFNTRSSEKATLEVSDEERLAEYEARWEQGGLPFLAAYTDMILDQKANDLAADFVRTKIAAIVKDPALAEKLTPRTILGCKRLCADTGYFETFNRDNVSLVDVNDEPIREVTADGIRVGEREIPLDILIFATGFDAMTGSLLAVDIRGRGGLPLRAKWEEGPRTYLGLATAGFPNLFMITGPGSPSVLSNMVPSIEQHVNWIGDLLTYMESRGSASIEAESAAENEWVVHVNEVASMTLYPGCNSWYLGANVPGKPRVFMPYFGFPAYVEKANEVAASGYRGFTLEA
jgi:cation diffusion facilitator CzcD-associated flavoprotein CzcO